MQTKEQYMRRCIELAEKGAGYVAPNPMVGAVLVHAGKITGEGWHQKYGEAHAEVNCINDAISKGFEKLIASSVLYVSLEPCAH
jgi:diaminohydroxyphosphoribosylaminopyrimidine deaminase / 5-amino-6-(5-phosphoribosylamino)uracil reductase